MAAPVRTRKFGRSKRVGYRIPEREWRKPRKEAGQSNKMSPDSLIALVETAEYSGSHVRLDSIVEDHAFAAEAPTRKRADQEMQVHIRFDAESVHFFDSDTQLSMTERR